MSKFAKTHNVVGSGPIKATAVKTHTHEGDVTNTLDDKSALFTLGVTNMVSEDTFYESAGTRDRKFRDLVHKVTKTDPDWMQRFIPWLRKEANMRSAAIVAVAEYVKAGGPNGRALVRNTLSRADEPAEILAYWTTQYGKRIPAALKRGVADSLSGLYNEYTVLKYDSQGHDFRMGDVIQLVHPNPSDPYESAVYKYALDRRYKGNDAEVPTNLERLAYSQELVERVKTGHLPTAEELDRAGWTWERLSSYRKLDAETWESIIPTMGYMALLRNLRNFDEAGISQESVEYVKSVLADPGRVAASRQLPFRFLSADKYADTRRWGATLETALNLSVQNVPEFSGRTLVLVDTSGSMTWRGISKNSSVTPMEIGAIFGAAVALKNDADLVTFADYGKEITVPKNGNVLDVARKFRSGQVGHGTAINNAVRSHYNGHDRIVVFTDMQWFPGGNAAVNQAKFVHAFNLVGYNSSVDTSTPGRFQYAGWTDSLMNLMPLLERGQIGDWPWE